MYICTPECDKNNVKTIRVLSSINDKYNIKKSEKRASLIANDVTFVIFKFAAGDFHLRLKSFRIRD